MKNDTNQLFGLKIEPLSSNAKPMAAITFIKVEDDDGEIKWLSRDAGEYINSEEVLGFLISYMDYLREELASNWDWRPSSYSKQEG